jgi:hypothetical protein
MSILLMASSNHPWQLYSILALLRTADNRGKDGELRKTEREREIEGRNEGRKERRKEGKKERRL